MATCGYKIPTTNSLFTDKLFNFSFASYKADNIIFDIDTEKKPTERKLAHTSGTSSVLNDRFSDMD